MKNKWIFIISALLICTLVACATAPRLSESARQFEQETGLSLVIPMRFFTWVRVENSNRVQPDITNNVLNFEYDASGDFLVKINAQGNNINSVWGKQILLQEGWARQFVFTSFIPAIYALETGSEPLDIAFDSLNQILADRAYTAFEQELLEVFQEGLRQYRIGGAAWQNFKTTNFIVENRTIRIR